MAEKLYKEDSSNPSYKYQDGAPPAGYSETDAPEDWSDAAYPYLIPEGLLTFDEFWDKIKAAYDAIGTPDSTDKKAASKWFAVDKSVRDSVHSDSEQKDNAREIYHYFEPETVEQAFMDEVITRDATDAKEAIDATLLTIAGGVHMYMNVSGTVELNCSFNANAAHHITVDGNATLDFDCISNGVSLYLMLKQDGTGGHTITLPTFSNLDTQPVVTTTAGKMDTLIIMMMAGGPHLHAYVRHTDTY